MAYSYATLQNALDALDARLYNQVYQFWSQEELTLYIREALRTWNALTNFWRSEMNVISVNDVWWYDLATAAGSLVNYTVTQSELIQLIQSHLLEPINTTYPLVWTGSTQFSFSDILSALQRRQDDTLGTTACVYTRSTPTAAATIRTVLGDGIIDIRRVAWLPSSTYTNKILSQSDFFAERAFNVGYTFEPAQPPSVWMQNTEPPPSFDVDTVPPVAGLYDVLSINAGPDWSAASDHLMNMPDDWAWVVKWGALADLLSKESNAKDVVRAEYCKKRYEEGLALLDNAPLVLASRISSKPVAVDSVSELDKYNPLWQSATAAAPIGIANARNLVAAYPQPNAGYLITFSVCQNAPVPVSTADFIQVAKDCYDSILDIAQHLAAFKMGGSEFVASIALYQKAQKKASEYNGKLADMGFFELPQLDLSQLQETQDGGRYLPGTAPTK